MSEIGDKIQEKCEAFGDRVIKLNDYLLEQECKKEDERCKKGSRIPITLKSVAALSNQLLRAGTSIGANVREAVYAQSRADFNAKMYIALKEAGESAYWIELLERTEYLTPPQAKSIYDDCDELIKILSSITKTTKTNRKDDEHAQSIPIPNS